MPDAWKGVGHIGEGDSMYLVQWNHSTGQGRAVGPICGPEAINVREPVDGSTVAARSEDEAMKNVDEVLLRLGRI